MQGPLISVVIPTYNRPEELAGALSALADSEYPRELLEVIVVDDGGTRPLDNVVAACRSNLDLRLARREDKGGPGPARNTGVQLARGALVAFTDDDCRVDRLWLAGLAARFAAHPNRAIGGRTLNAARDNPYSAASQAVLDVLFDHYNRDPEEATFLVGNNFAFPTDALREMGGFNPAFHLCGAEDREFCDRWIHAGRQMTYAPECVVYHGRRLDLGSLWRQHFNYGRGAHRFYQARVKRGLGRVRVEPWLNLRFLGRPFAQLPPLAAARVSALVAVTQAAAVAGYFSECAMRARETAAGAVQ